jgi:Family of unknown function (DUF5995)
VPKAWAPVFEARDRRGIAPIQFALAGMNAHINRDLPFALVETWEALDLGPDRTGVAFRDFTLVNELLERTEAQVKAEFATDALGHVDRSLGDVDDAVAIWKVSRARETAWANAEALWALRGVCRTCGRSSRRRSTGSSASRGGGCSDRFAEIRSDLT